MQWIKRAWRGEERLWKVFWVYGILAGYALDAVTMLGFVMLIPHVHLMPWHAPVWLYVLGAVWTIFLWCFSIWTAVALWKCSFNSGRRYWGYAARVAYVLSVVLTVSHLVGFSGDTDSWEIDCEKLMRDYAMKQGLNPQTYISENQAYVHKCTEWPHFYDNVRVSVVKQPK